MADQQESNTHNVHEVVQNYIANLVLEKAVSIHAEHSEPDPNEVTLEQIERTADGSIKALALASYESYPSSHWQRGYWVTIKGVNDYVIVEDLDYYESF